MHGAGCVRQWFRTAEPLGERRYENWNTHTHTVASVSRPLNNLQEFLFASLDEVVLRNGKQILSFKS